MPTLERLAERGRYSNRPSVSPITEASHPRCSRACRRTSRASPRTGPRSGPRRARAARAPGSRVPHGRVRERHRCARRSGGAGRISSTTISASGEERRGDRTIDRVIAWLEDAPRPFYLWASLRSARSVRGARTADGSADGRTPLALPQYSPEGDRAITSAAWITAAYDGEVRFADEQLARLVSKLDLEHTILAVVADHGENLDYTRRSSTTETICTMHRSVSHGSCADPASPRPRATPGDARGRTRAARVGRRIVGGCEVRAGAGHDAGERSSSIRPCCTRCGCPDARSSRAPRHVFRSRRRPGRTTST
jgi:hypothetical protein